MKSKTGLRAGFKTVVKYQILKQLLSIKSCENIIQTLPQIGAVLAFVSQVKFASVEGF